ncbi:hypothetical protein JCM5353_000203 [Sporobolomyces roseus]
MDALTRWSWSLAITRFPFASSRTGAKRSSASWNKAEPLPPGTARKTDFDLIWHWFDDLVKTINEGKVSIVNAKGDLLPRWTIDEFLLLKKINSMGQAGENAAVNNKIMVWWDKEMAERFGGIQDQEHVNKAAVEFNRLLSKIKQKEEEGGTEAVVRLFSSQGFEPEQIFSRLFSKSHHALNLLSDPAPSHPTSRSPSSQFTVGKRQSMKENLGSR